MKKLVYSFISLFILAVSFTSCVDDKDYDTPQVSCEEPIIPTGQLSTIKDMREKWAETSSLTELAAADDEPLYISGYVISSDKTGNFYQELFIQDALENPQYSVKIAIGVSSLYTKYDIGRKIYVKVNGLVIDKSHGEMVIGEKINGALDNIRENTAKECIFRGCDTDNEVTPRTINPSQISDGYLGMYIKFDDLQFIFEDVESPFVNPSDSYDSYKYLMSCSSNAEVVLETSTYASFGGQIVPSGNGSVEGILSRDYSDSFYVLRVNDPNAFSFTEERCPVLFQDGFSNGFNKWTTYNVTGTEVWTIDPQYGNPLSCAKISGYTSGNHVNEDWLITQAIDLSQVIGSVMFSFQSARGYTGNNLVVAVSTNYDGLGNPNSFTWTTLSPVLGTSWTYVDSGNMNLSGYIGQTIYIAFKYTSTTSGAATYELDNVKVQEL